MRFFTRSLFGLGLLGLTVAILVLSASTLMNAIQEKNEAGDRQRNARERVFAVNVADIQLQSVIPKITTFGEVVSARTLEVRATAGGSLVKISPNFRDGGVVAKGELLFQTNPASAEANLKLAETELTEAVNELTEAEEALILSQDELAAARRQFDLREQALGRQKSLRQRNVGTEAAIETAALAASSAEQSVLAKRQQVANAKSRIKKAATALSRSEISFQEAQRQANETSVTAEFDGVLSNVSVLLGGLVNANEKLGELLDPNALEVAFRISSEQFTNLTSIEGGLNAAKVFVDFTGFGNPIPAQIDRVSAAVGEGQTGRELFARIKAQSAQGLRPGDFVSVSIEEPVIQRAALLPSTAVSSSGEVLLLDGENRLQAKRVNIERRQGDAVIVTGSELQNRTVVLERAPQLGEGIRVDPRSRDATPKPKPELVKLSEEEQKRLIAAVKERPMPKDVKDRILKQLGKGEVPQKMYDRITANMKG